MNGTFIILNEKQITEALAQYLRKEGKLATGETFQWATGGPTPTECCGHICDQNSRIASIVVEVQASPLAAQGRAILADADAAIAKGNAKPEEAYKEASKGQ